MKLIKNLNSSEDPFNFANNLSVEQLEELILYTSDKYYNEKPVISDARWDILVDFLRLKNPKSKVLKEVGSSIKSKDKDRRRFRKQRYKRDQSIRYIRPSR